MKQDEKERLLNEQHTIILDREARLSSTDYIAAKIAEGKATKAEYKDQIAERQGWRDDINAAQGFALISIFYYLKDSFGKIHTAAFGCSYTGSCQRSFVNAVKPGNHYFTRNHFQVSGEDVTNIYRHDIVGADDRIRKHVSF